MIKLALFAASLLTPIADVREAPLPPPRPVEIGPDRTGEAIRITALARFSAERCDTRIDRVKLDATLARLNADIGYGASGEGRAIGDSFSTVYGGNPRLACAEAWDQLGVAGTVAPGVLIRP